MHNLHLDVETFCDLDLKKVGVHRYVTHASFRVLCVAWKFEGRAVQSMVVSEASPSLQHNLPAVLVAALQSPDVQGHAFNSAFETAILNKSGLSPLIRSPALCNGHWHTVCRVSWRLLPRRSVYPIEGHGRPSVNVEDVTAFEEGCGVDS
jgi:hypothetical protein